MIAGLDALGHAIPPGADRQRAQRGKLGEDGDRWPEGAGRVLRLPQIDRHLAADGAVGLGEPGDRDMDQRQAPRVEGGGGPDKVTDGPATHRDHGRAALDADA